ncbi:hypothetical protein BJY00DRAFT_282406 [Aspergillus carlsbadensis]|nr:hypothetical protein BJY00DRAFT_282406 [Aspergillus carlsbadensis]
MISRDCSPFLLFPPLFSSFCNPFLFFVSVEKLRSRINSDASSRHPSNDSNLLPVKPGKSSHPISPRKPGSWLASAA